MITSIRRQCAGCLRKAHSFVDSHLRYWKHHLKLPTRPMLKLGRKTLASRKFSTVSWPSDRKAIHGGRLPSFPSIVFKLKCLVGLEALAASFISNQAFNVVYWQILLQKSQIAERQFFRQKTRQAV